MRSKTSAKYIKKQKQKQKHKKYKKATIPKAIREQCWLRVFGEKFKGKCYVNWCKNTINVFDYHVGHDIPESIGGTLDVSNLKPICARCNLSMSNNYTIKEWDNLNKQHNKCCRFWFRFWKR